MLVVTYQAERWAVVRLGVDGSMEYAVAPAARDDGRPARRSSSRPAERARRADPV